MEGPGDPRPAWLGPYHGEALDQVRRVERATQLLHQSPPLQHLSHDDRLRILALALTFELHHAPPEQRDATRDYVRALIASRVRQPDGRPPLRAIAGDTP